MYLGSSMKNGEQNNAYWLVRCKTIFQNIIEMIEQKKRSLDYQENNQNFDIQVSYQVTINWIIIFFWWLTKKNFKILFAQIFLATSIIART